VLFPIKKILNIDKYFVCESRDMSDESGIYIIVLKLKTIFGQGRLVSNIGPGQSSALRPISMQTLTEINYKWSIKLNIYFLY
jgi:hypothetical protein